MLHPTPITSLASSQASSHGVPEVVGVEVSRELLVDVHHMNITFLCVADNGLGVKTSLCIRLNVNIEQSVDLELESAKSC